jgi:hypothetical protein
MRKQSAKLQFYDLAGEGATIQIMFNASKADGMSEAEYAWMRDNVGRGDIVGVEGWPGKTKLGAYQIGDGSGDNRAMYTRTHTRLMRPVPFLCCCRRAVHRCEADGDPLPVHASDSKEALWSSKSRNAVPAALLGSDE